MRVLHRLITLTLFGLLLGLLGACSTSQALKPVDGPADTETWEDRRAWLLEQDRWDLDGRTAIAAYDEGWNASILWRQRGILMDVRLSGPLGFGSARVTGTPELLTVETSDGETFVTSDPETDLYWQLGWTAPLDRMRYWVLGLPGPGEVSGLEVDGAGRLRGFRQGRWQVDFEDYLQVTAPDGSQRALPRKLEMFRDNVRIRLIVAEWELQASLPRVDDSTGSEKRRSRPGLRIPGKERPPAGDAGSTPIRTEPPR
ncbi:MAG: lipoprotein insertase outer membrane protein LolB [Gammaproteobacteria bacterium]|nr:lipoprotein insertase outer membrane protein LolB [Gammaproteobacteria bacterium]